MDRPYLIVDTDDVDETRAVVAHLNVTVTHPADDHRFGPQGAADTVLVSGPDIDAAAALLDIDPDDNLSYVR